MKTNGTEGIPEYARSQSSAINNYTIMGKTYKRVPFDIELAKKIQSGEVEGRIVDGAGYIGTIVTFNAANTPLPIVVKFEFDDADNIFFVGVDGVATKIQLFIELPEETTKYKIPTIPTYEQWKEKETSKHEFKVGDKVSIGDYNEEDVEIYTIVKIRENLAFLDDGSTISFDDLMLRESKHEFKPFDKVLVRHLDSDVWIPAIYEGTLAKSYWCTDGYEYDQCIPYEGNEHLVGTTDNPE